MEQDYYMPYVGAMNLIQLGHKIAHIRHWTGPYFLVKTPGPWVSEDAATFGEACKEIPSWMWIKDQSSWKIHFLDIPTLEGIAFKAGYTPKYDPATEAVMKGLKAGYLERREWKKGALVEIPCKRALCDYQIVGAQFLYKAQRALIGDSPGVGKSAATIGAILLNKIDNLPYKTLILCPASVKGAWLKELGIVTDELRPIVLESKMEKRYAQYENLANCDVLISSYDSFIRDYDDLPKYFKPDILVLDEIHRASNRKNKITQTLIGGKSIKKTFLQVVNPRCIYELTGSPIGNKLEDLYPLMRIIDPGMFSWGGFCNRYTIQEQAQVWRHNGGVSRPVTFTKVTGYKNAPELKAKLSLCMIRRTKQDVLTELPAKSLQIREIELGTEERKIYNDLRKDYKAEIRGKEITIIDQIVWSTRAQQIADSLELVPGSDAKKSSKMEELIEVVDARATLEKIVIFSKFSKMVDIMAREFKNSHPIVLTGDTPTDKRAKLIADFQEDPKYRLFLATYGAGGVGVTLHAASTVILYDVHWNPAACEQAIGRLDRKGQVNPVTVIVMKSLDTIDQRTMDVVSLKQGIIDSTVGDESTTLAGMTREQLENLI